MKTTAKEVLESDNWIIIKISLGLKKNVRIDARTRFHIADGKNSYSEWISVAYANKLYGKSIFSNKKFQF